MFENLGNKLKTLRVKGNFSRHQIAELTTDSLSLDGLTDKQIKALKLTADCFRSQNSF